MNLIIRGAAGGLAGTLTMTGIMFAAKGLGVLHRPLPKVITQRLIAKAGIPRPVQPNTAAWAATAAAHVPYGTGAGVFYALVRNFFPRQPAVTGAVYGFGLWATSYLGLMPGLDLYPGSTEVTTSQKVAMILANEVYGSTLAQVESRLS